MGSTVRVIYENGVFRPMEPVTLPDRWEGEATLVPAAPKDTPPADENASFGWRSLHLVEWIAEDFDEPLEEFREYME